MIGSQAILGSVDDPPEELLQSMEADLYPLANPADADKIDGALGDGSQFHVAFGYYAHGVGPETAKAPAAWEDRLVKREIPPRLALDPTGRQSPGALRCTTLCCPSVRRDENAIGITRERRSRAASCKARSFSNGPKTSRFQAGSATK